MRRCAITAPVDISSLTLGQAAAKYLGALEPDKRELAAAEINRFVSQLGPNRPLSSLTKTDVDKYQQRLIDSKVNSSQRVEPVKVFLTDLKTRKWTEQNLGAVLRVRRRGASGGGQRDEGETIELTREGYEQLKAELAQLEEERLPQLREYVAAARLDGDFRENAPYDEAKREMGTVQGQIDKLKQQLRQARIVARESSGLRIGLGSRVVLKDLQYGDEQTFVIVGPGEVDPRNRKISIHSPVGGALRDRTVGDEIEVDIPTGRAHYRVLRIEKG